MRVRLDSGRTQIGHALPIPKRIKEWVLILTPLVIKLGLPPITGKILNN